MLEIVILKMEKQLLKISNHSLEHLDLLGEDRPQNTDNNNKFQFLI